MQLKDVMTPEVEVIAPEASIYEAAEKMSHRDVGPLPVCDGDRLIGLLTDRDITVRATAAGCDPTMIQVCDVMTANLVYCFEDQHIRRLPVLNHHHRLVGIVSLDDLAVSGDTQLAGKTLKAVSKLSGPQH